MSVRKVISTDKAPKAIGPYSQAIAVGDFLFVSGQLPLNPQTGDIVAGDIEAQTRQSIENTKSILASVGTSLSNVVKTTVFLKDMSHFPQMNVVYAQYFSSNAPARSCVEVSRLPKDALLEIESIALIDH